jgi:hypothetical protein
MDVTVNRRPSALAVGTRSPKSAERTSPRRCAASSAADATLNHPVDIVPDAHWPNMWRLAYEDGRLSGMVNLTRASMPSAAPGLAQRNVMHEIEETRRIAQREMGLILPSVEAVIPPQVRLGSSEAVSQAGSSHLRAQAHLRHRSLDQVREDGSRLLHGRRRDIGAERIAQTRTSALA